MDTKLKLDYISRRDARMACERWHYSRTIPAAKSVCIGVWEDARFIGAVVFTCGSGAATDGTKYGLAKQFDIAELQRVALRKHKAAVSRIIAIAIRLLKRSSPKLKMLISFADPSNGHHGGIYQAGGWFYTGRSSNQIEFKLSDGRWVHRRVIGMQWGKFEKASRLVTGEQRVAPGKHRYLLPLVPELIPSIKAMAKPYPKRAVSIVADATANHAVEGGSLPTTALLPKIPQETGA